MKAILNKLLLIILLLLPLSVFGQSYSNAQPVYYVPNAFQIAQYNITTNVISNGWAQYGTTCAGCASYYYKITKTSQVHRAEDGQYYYYYYIWFFSNSYYSNGQQASTYLTNISAYINGQLITTSPYYLATHVENYSIWLRSSIPNANITFNVTQMSVY